MSHFIQLRYSNDGANNYGDWRDLEAGGVGSFLQPLIARRLGMCRHRVWEIRDTSNVAADIIAAELMADGE